MVAESMMVWFAGEEEGVVGGDWVSGSGMAEVSG